MILYSIKQIPDQSNAQKNKQVRLEGELHWIKTLGTQFLHGMNHKILSKHDVVITFPFSSNAINAFKITKNICTKLKAMYPNIYKAELMCSFKCNRNTYENLNLRALKNLTLCKNIRIFLDVLKSELCSFFCFAAAFNSSHNHGNQALFLPSLLANDYSWHSVGLLWKKHKQFEHLLSYSDQS